GTNSPSPRTIVTPMLDPWALGLTTQGNPSSCVNCFTTSARLPGQAPPSTIMYGGNGSPLASPTWRLRSLSIASALASTPDPVYGMPSNSSRPWIVPSSPYGPCRAMNATSTAPSPTASSLRRGTSAVDGATSGTAPTWGDAPGAASNKRSERGSNVH